MLQRQDAALLPITLGRLVIVISLTVADRCTAAGNVLCRAAAEQRPAGE